MLVGYRNVGMSLKGIESNLRIISSIHCSLYFVLFKVYLKNIFSFMLKSYSFSKLTNLLISAENQYNSEIHNYLF